MNRSRVKVLVRGQVQGVGFRYFTQRTAESLNLAGWVRNRSDGAVEAELEGSETAIEAALKALRQGPDGGHVESLSSEGLACQGHPDGFHVRF